MKRRAILLVLVGALAGCPSGPTRCPIPLPAANPVKVFGISGHSLAITVSQPVVGCQPPAATATVSLIDPNNRSFTAYTSSSSAGGVGGQRLGGPTETIVFTPDLPGNWQLVVTFEPSLGRVQMAIDVADERLQTSRSTVDVPYNPVYCVSQPFMTLHGLVLCELDGGIHTQRAGESDVVFAGRQLVVLGDTVWAFIGNDLTRFTDTGSRLRVDGTVSAPGVSLTDHAFTSEVTAVRAFDARIRDGGSAGTVVRYDFTDAGLTAALVRGLITDAFFVRDGTVYRVGRDRVTRALKVCNAEATDGGCVILDGPVLALDDAGLWAASALSSGGVDFIDSPQVGAAGARSYTLGDKWSAHPRLHNSATLDFPSRALVDREAAAAFNQNEVGPLVVRHALGDFTLGFYGQGGLLGTRGDFLVLLAPDGAPRVSFIRY